MTREYETIDQVEKALRACLRQQRQARTPTKPLVPAPPVVSSVLKRVRHRQKRAFIALPAVLGNDTVLPSQSLPSFPSAFGTDMPVFTWGDFGSALECFGRFTGFDVSPLPPAPLAGVPWGYAPGDLLGYFEDDFSTTPLSSPPPRGEWMVDTVLNHRETSSGAIEYQVKWHSGEVTWEPRSCFVEVDATGTEISVTAALSDYQEKTTRL